MSTSETWTVGRLLTWTTDYLKKNGSTSPRLDAEVLLAHARNCERIELYTAFAEEPGEETRTAFREMVRRRAEGTPVAYLVGHKEFYSMAFEVNQDVLIPRGETEHVVVEALDRAKDLRQLDSTKALHIADVGTGSGAIAVTIAKHLPNCHVLAIDQSAAALEVAMRNAQRHRVSDRMDFVQSDLFSAVSGDSLFDLILSNPPYVSEAEFDKLPRNVRDYEPRDALVSGPLGTEVIARLLTQAGERLTLGGYFICELSPMIAGTVEKMIDLQKWNAPHMIKDLAGQSRVLSVQRQKDR